MALLPPLLFLFDTTALLAGRTPEWQEFARLGECYLPEAVLEQMEFMCDRASEPDVESKAREFGRFYPDSGWKRTGIQAEHPTLKPAPGHTLSKRARLSLTVATCAYGMALRYPGSLIVVVANDQPMLQQVLGLQLKNLCGMPYTVLMQWVRSQRRPPVITHHLQLMRTATNQADKPAPSATKTASKTATQSVRSSRLATPSRSDTLSTTPGAYAAQRQRSYARSRRVSGLLSSVISLVILLAAIVTVWHILSPTSLNQFWRSLPFVGTPR